MTMSFTMRWLFTNDRIFVRKHLLKRHLSWALAKSGGEDGFDG